VNIEVIEEHSASVTCVGEGHPAPQTYWFRSGSPTPLLTGVAFSILRNGTLIIKKMKSNIQGEYFCKVENSLGSVDVLFNISMLCEFILHLELSGVVQMPWIGSSYLRA